MKHRLKKKKQMFNHYKYSSTRYKMEYQTEYDVYCTRVREYLARTKRDFINKLKEIQSLYNLTNFNLTVWTKFKKPKGVN